MGGCRCTFRSCKVNTIKCPGMHFFRYPVQNKERLAVWVKNSNYTAINDLPFSKARNKVVCALHFRDECFMNYLKDRLVPNAVPTLLRLRNGLVLDYSESANPRPTTLPPVTAKHLIPPAGFLPLGLPEDYFSASSSNVELLDDLDVPEDKVDEVQEPPVKRRKSTPIILNKGVYSETSSASGQLDEQSTSNEVLELTDDPLDDEVEEQFGILMVENAKGELTAETISGTATSEVDVTLNLEEIEFLQEEKDRMDMKGVVCRAVYEQTVDAFEAEVLELKQSCETQKLEAEAREADLKTELAAAREKAKAAEEREQAAQAMVKTLREKLEACEKQNKEKAAVGAAPKEESAVPNILTRQIKKPQLFNSIKRYLSASMTSLVCMEMFGGAERPWKPAEKRTALELLQLGENVYDYFTEEWRFRLHSKKLVKKWQDEDHDEEEEI